MRGSGPLFALAQIKEYLPALKPKKIVLWFYYEGNDLSDLKVEQQSRLLRRYMEDGFTQNLFDRQTDIDRALTEYATRGRPPNSYGCQPEQETPFPDPILTMKLTALRTGCHCSVTISWTIPRTMAYCGMSCHMQTRRSVPGAARYVLYTFPVGRVLPHHHIQPRSPFRRRLTSRGGLVFSQSSTTCGFHSSICLRHFALSAIRWPSSPSAAGVTTTKKVIVSSRMCWKMR